MRLRSFAHLTAVKIATARDQVRLKHALAVVALENGAIVYSGDVAGLFGDVRLVRRLGLGLPAAGELALELSARERVFGTLPLTLDQLLAALGCEA